MAQPINQNKLNFTKKHNPNDVHNIDSGGPCDIQTINDSSRLIFFVSKFFGYSLFTLPKINLKNHKICRKFKIKTTFTEIGILVTVILVYAYLFYYSAVSRFKLQLSESLILTLGGHIFLTISLAVSIAAIILSFVRRETVFKIFINLCYIDILLETFHDTLVMVPFSKRSLEKKLKTVQTPNNAAPPILNHKNHFTFSVCFLAIGLIIVGLDLVVSYYLINIVYSSNPFLFVTFALQNASFLIITVQAVLFYLAIMTRCSALNNLICCYLTIQDCSNHPVIEELYNLELIADNQLGFNTENSSYVRNVLDRKVIAEFAQIHDKLSDIVEWINCCYAVQCLGVVVVSFSYVILTFFSFYYALYHPHGQTLQLTITNTAWLIFYIFCMMSLIVASWATTTEGKATGVLLHKSINQILLNPRIEAAQSNEIIDSLRIFSQQLQKRSPIVSCGLFTYDWTLLFAIIASSATYLIILIQFDSSKVSCTYDTNKTSNVTLE